MFMTPREPKCNRLSRSLAGQSVFTQRQSASPSSRMTSFPHSGKPKGTRNCASRADARRLPPPQRLWESRRRRAPPLPSRRSSVRGADEVRVVQRGAAHRDAADKDRRQRRRGRKLAAAAYVISMSFTCVIARLRGELVRNRPARRAAGVAQALLRSVRSTFSTTPSISYPSVARGSPHRR